MTAGALAAVGLVALPAASSPADAAGAGFTANHRGLPQSTPGLDTRLSHGGKVTRTATGARLAPQSVDSAGKTTVYVRGSDNSALIEAVKSVGGTVTGSLPGLVRAKVAGTSLKELAGKRGVSAVRPPDRLVADSVTAESVAASGADAWQSIGTGAGVKIGIVDLGFGELAAAQASGDLPATGTALSVTAETGCTDVNADSHGTAVTEIVHDMAPGAQLFLVCVNDTVDIGAAADFLHNAGVSVVNMSLSAPGLVVRGDGTGPLGDIIKRSRQQGLLWVVAAGNGEQDHFRGTAVDHNGDGWVEFSGTDAFNHFTVAPDSDGVVDLRWDAWPTTTTELQVIVMDVRRPPTSFTPGVDPDLVFVGTAKQSSNGPLPPDIGAFDLDNTGFATPWDLYIMIRNVNTPSSTTFDLNLFNNVTPLLYHNAGSISVPATSPYAMAVGAACVKNGALEPFSSQGPTIDGRTKPDITAFDGVSTTTFGPATPGTTCQDGFLGTSAAAPNTAGAAALVKSANPSFDAAQIESYLEEHATPAAGTANQFGHGLLNMGPLQVPQARQGDTYQTLAAPQRILDTRTTNGGHLGKVGQGEVLTLSVPGLAVDASAVAINLTATGPTTTTHLDVFPEVWTGTSTLNLVKGQTAAVFTMVALGPNHTIRIRNAAGNVDVVVDLLGSFTPSGGATFVSKNPPTRLLDTRTLTGGHLGKIGQGETFALQVAGVGGVPADATAVMVNVTGVNQTIGTHVDVFPNQPTGTSTLNLDATSLRSNVTAVGIGSDGKIRIQNSAGSLDVIVDLQGWFVPSGGARFVALDPTTRILDTRTGNGLHLGKLGAQATMSLQGSEIYGVPYNATAVAFNLTAAEPSQQTFIEAWPTGLPRPTASNINLLANQIVPNAVVLGTGTNGMVSLYNNSGSVRLVADLYGYFIP